MAWKVGRWCAFSLTAAAATTAALLRALFWQWGRGRVLRPEHPRTSKRSHTFYVVSSGDRALVSTKHSATNTMSYTF